MGRRASNYEFNITINPPTEENREAYDIRVGKAAAKILTEILTLEQIDALIEAYRKSQKA
ncbi:4-alpha-glucanotransferase [Clostridium sp. C8-1-8]|uniref:4-alpha-glucanotransferase n=1 Tax=Clostridium sp. C8-1-8 TaxID=2698831 RepID=UPI00136B2942|nr:4-alpha-glucanotransferase [Clostridium sp. C8-1-8]